MMRLSWRIRDDGSRCLCVSGLGMDGARCLCVSGLVSGLGMDGVRCLCVSGWG